MGFLGRLLFCSEARATSDRRPRRGAIVGETLRGIILDCGEIRPAALLEKDAKIVTA
jgi:hypothetical protein